MLRAELAGALMLLTRLPTGWLARGAPPAPPRCVWAYPLAGLAVGASGGLVCLAGARLGLAPAVTALLALALTIWATGALHEDGLADTADGFGGLRTPARRLEIMRDSRIGSYGAVALVLSLGLRGVALAALLPTPARAAAALVAAATLARGSMVVLLAVLPPARTDGLAATLGQREPGRILAALALAAGGPLALLPVREAGAALAAALLVTLALAATARRAIGGQTGDVLGAGAVLAECTALAVLSAGWGG